MNGSTLRYLAAVADLSRLDLEAVGISLVAGDGEITAGYAGNYARGSRTASFDGDDFEISISASRFKAIAAMFSNDDEQVDFRVIKDGLRIRSNSVNALLRSWGELADFPELDKSRIELAARMSTQELISELEAAAAFVSDSQVKPVLAGIRLEFDRVLSIIAFDGAGALYKGTINAPRIKGRGAIVAPTQDFLLGAKLLADGDAVLVKPEDSDAIAIYNNHALFRSSAIVGAWPDLSKPMSTRSDSTTFQVEANVIRNLVAAAKTLESGPDITVSQTKRGVMFGIESESGAFNVTVPGKVQTTLHYDAETLGKVVRLGSVLRFSVPSKPSDPTVIESEHRKCWIVTRM